MANDIERPRFSYATLLRALLPALAATGVVVLIFFARSPSARKKPRPDGKMSVTLSQKDSAFNPIPPSKGGASGEVLYDPAGTTFHLLLHASGIPRNHRYVLEIEADSTTYSVTSRAPDERGELVIDTALAQFQEGVCVGTNFDQPRPVTGRHALKIRLKRDGSPASGPMPGVPPTAPGARLACHGNGDGNYDYVLLENDVADFTGRAP
jgi:hypothetical protein